MTELNKCDCGMVPAVDYKGPDAPRIKCHYCGAKYLFRHGHEEQAIDDWNIKHPGKVAMTPEMMNLRIMGYSPAQIQQSMEWFETRHGKSMVDFWQEAFDAGVRAEAERIGNFYRELLAKTTALPDTLCKQCRKVHAEGSDCL